MHQLLLRLRHHPLRNLFCRLDVDLSTAYRYQQRLVVPQQNTWFGRTWRDTYNGDVEFVFIIPFLVSHCRYVDLLEVERFAGEEVGEGGFGGFAEGAVWACEERDLALSEVCKQAEGGAHFCRSGFRCRSA